MPWGSCGISVMISQAVAPWSHTLLIQYTPGVGKSHQTPIQYIPTSSVVRKSIHSSTQQEKYQTRRVTTLQVCLSTAGLRFYIKTIFLGIDANFKMQNFSNSIPDALELPQSCATPLILICVFFFSATSAYGQSLPSSDYSILIPDYKWWIGH